MEFRKLTENDIEVRVQSIKSKDGKPYSAILLLYKNARVDMNILDETVGAENWQREHYDCKGNLFCRVGVRVNDAWIWKSDCGVESQTEAQKGEASDSFKRACFNWGIGRELYTGPVIRITADKFHAYETGRKDNRGNPVFATYDNFRVEKIIIEKPEGKLENQITAISIVNDSIKSDKIADKRCFVWKKSV